MYVLNLAEDNRILSACIKLDGIDYGDMPIVDALPDGNVPDYKYVNGKYVYDPLPEPEVTDPEPTLEDRVTQTEADIAFIAMMSDIEL